MSYLMVNNNCRPLDGEGLFFIPTVAGLRETYLPQGICICGRFTYSTVFVSIWELPVHSVIRRIVKERVTRGRRKGAFNWR